MAVSDEHAAEPPLAPVDPERRRRREALLEELANGGGWRQRLRARRTANVSAREAMLRHLRDAP